MGSYSKNDIILVRYPFSDLSGSKVGKDSGVRKDLLIFGYKEARKPGGRTQGSKVQRSTKRTISDIHHRDTETMDEKRWTKERQKGEGREREEQGR